MSRRLMKSTPLYGVAADKTRRVRMLRAAADRIDDRCDGIVDDVIAAPRARGERRIYPDALDILTAQAAALRRAGDQ